MSGVVKAITGGGQKVQPTYIPPAPTQDDAANAAAADPTQGGTNSGAGRAATIAAGTDSTSFDSTTDAYSVRKKLLGN